MAAFAEIAIGLAGNLCLLRSDGLDLDVGRAEKIVEAAAGYGVPDAVNDNCRLNVTDR